MEIETWRNSLDSISTHKKIFDEDLVLPTKTLKEIDAFADMITAADMLTALEIGSFSISETAFHDPDGTRFRYKGDREFTNFAELAYTFTQEMKRCKDVFEAARIATLKHPKVPPKTQGNSNI